MAVKRRWRDMTPAERCEVLSARLRCRDRGFLTSEGLRRAAEARRARNLATIRSWGRTHA